MVRGDPVTISAGASTKRAVAGMAGRQGGGGGGTSLSHRFKLLAIMPYGTAVVPVILG